MVLTITRQRRTETLNSKFHPLDSEDWGRICSVRFPGGCRETIGALYALNGIGVYGEVLKYCEGRLAQINRAFRDNNLPYRIRSCPQIVRGRGAVSVEIRLCCLN